MTEAVACPRCGATNDPSQRFCGSCGGSLARACPSCGSENPAGFRFCGSCGAAIEGAPSTPAPAEERRWATVIFADLSGFTSLSERMDPEDVRTLVDRCMAKLTAIVERYGGVVQRIIGDAAMAVFGAPVSHEDDPERAVRAALDMVRYARDNAEEFAGLPLRIGVNSGEMMFAPVGPQGARHVTMMGDAVNVAARLQAAAPRHGVLVGATTHKATRRAISYEDTDPITAKGKDEPVPAWLARSAHAAPAERPMSEAPTIGRDKELRLVRNLWEGIRHESRPHLVTVLGPAGIGKSRLARDITTMVESEDGLVLRGRALPYGETSGYGAFAQMVKHAAQILDGDPPSEATDKLRAAVAVVLDGEADEVARSLGVLIGLESEAVNPDRGTLFFAARRFVEALGRRRATALLFEDIHWADASMLDLIEALSARVRGAAVFFVTLARPELLDARPAWGGGLLSYTALPLAPLSEDETRELVGHLMPGATIAAGVADRLSETAAGNPLFIEELAASLADKTAEAAETLPTNIKAIIAARLDALPAPERQVILDASVVGKIFWPGALERIFSRDRLAHMLDVLETRDFIRREPASRFQGEDEYSFKHMLIREVAYATLSKAARRERHEAVAQFIESAAKGRLGESATVLALHWREAGRSDLAADYLVRGAENARRAWAKGEAVSMYAQALELIGDTDAVKRREIELAHALALFEAADYPAAAKELDALLPILQGRDLFEATLARGRSAFWMVDAEGGARYGDAAIALAEELGDPESRARAYSLSVDISSMPGRLTESVRMGERAMAEWPPGVRPAEYAILLSQKGIAHYWLGENDAAVELLRRSDELGSEVHAIEPAVVPGTNLGLALAGLGRHEEAIQVLARVVAHGRELELVLRFTSRAMNAWAGVLRELADVEGARRLNEEGIEMGAKSAFLNAVVQGKTDLVFADIAEGEFSRAEAALPALMQEAEKLKGWHEWLVGGRIAAAQAEILLGLGRLEAAADAAAASIERSAAVGRLKYDVASRTVLGSALQRMGRADEAIVELQRALTDAKRLGHPQTEWTAARALRAALVASGDDAAAEAAFEAARARLHEFAAGLSEQRRKAFLASTQVVEVLKAPA